MSHESLTERGSAVEHWKVVVNDEEQYSIWFADRPAPEGWHEVGSTARSPSAWTTSSGMWTDMQPKSLRILMDDSATGH